MSIKDDLMDRSITAAIQSRRIDGSIQPLTKPPGLYLTGYEGSKCEQIKPVSVQWRKEFDNKVDTFYEESYSDGYSQGYAAGMSYVSKPYTDAQKAKNKQMRDMIQGIDIDEFKKQCEDIDKGES